VRVDRPEIEERIGCRWDAEVFDLVERHGRVVLFWGVGAVWVAELPGRIGVDKFERPLRWRRCRWELAVAVGAADAAGRDFGRECTPPAFMWMSF
jgi:hypothetical protein